MTTDYAKKIVIGVGHLLLKLLYIPLSYTLPVYFLYKECSTKVIPRELI